MTSSRPLHLYAVFAAFATFCLIIAGGLVTSTGSGLSVPTWPLAPHAILPPLVGGVLFEYGHRMVAGTVILLTAILVTWIHRSDARKPLRVLGLIAIAAIVAQALLGGITVLMQLPPAVSVAHAGLAQAFFCVMVCIAYLSSPDLCERGGERAPSALFTLTIVTPAVIYAQILVGAVMRHTGAWLMLPTFPLAFGHLIPPAGKLTFPVAINFAHTRIGALVVSIFVIWTAALALKTAALRKTAAIILFILALQISLGIATLWSWRAVVPTTAHVAVGALLFVTNVLMALQARFRLAANAAGAKGALAEA